MKSVLLLFLLAVLALAACGEKPDQRVAQLKGLSPEQQVTLSAWLKRNPNHRPAVDKDCHCESELDEYRLAGPWGRALSDYRPYLQIGDFNKDGQKDVAIIFLDEKSDGDAGVLAVFNGPFNDMTREPAFKEPTQILHVGLVYSPADGKALGIGHFEPEYCPLVPHGKTYAWDCDY